METKKKKIDVEAILKDPSVTSVDLYEASVELKEEASRRLLASGFKPGAKVSYINGNDGKTYIGFHNPFYQGRGERRDEVEILTPYDQSEAGLSKGGDKSKYTRDEAILWRVENELLLTVVE
jgi:hypothetical protein